MTDVIGRGVIQVAADSTELKAGIEEAKRSVKTLGAEIGTSVAAGSQRAETAVKAIGAAVGDSLGGGAAKAQRSIEAYVKSVELSASNIGKTFREQKLAELSSRGATTDQLARASAALQTVESFKAQQREARLAGEAARAATAVATAGMLNQATATKLTAFQQQQLGFQLNDFFVQIASGQSPLTAFVQQGSQLSGTFGGMRNAFAAVLSTLTPLRVALAGAAGALAGIGFAFFEGKGQSAEFDKALQLTGNFAGQTEGQFNDLTRAVSKASGETVGNVREIGQALLSTGQIGPQVFAQATAAATGYAKATGKTAEEVAKDFASMAQSPAKFAAEANRQLNFITVAQYASIKAFEDAGRAADAQGVVFDALNRRFPTVTQNLGYLEKSLLVAKSAWSSFWDSALDVGRTETIDQKIAKTQAAIDAIKPREVAETGGGAGLVAQSPGRRRSTQAALLAELQGTQTDQFKRILREQENAFSQAQKDSVEKAGIAAVDFKAKALEAAKSVGALNKELAENKRQFDAAAAAGVPFSEAEKKVIDEATRRKFADTKGLGDAAAERRALLQSDLKSVQDILAQQLDAFTRAGSLLEAARGAQLLSETDYFNAKRALAQGEADAEEKILIDQIARLEVEAADTATKQKDRIDLLRQASALEARLAGVRADAAVKTTVLDIQEADSRKKVALAIDEQRRSLDAYLQSLRESFALEAALVGRGDRQAAETRQRQQIEDKFRQQEEEVRRRERAGQLPAEQAEREVAAIAAAKRRELEIVRAGNAAILNAQADWTNGMTRALEDYVTQAQDIAGQMEKAFGNAFQGMEDALVKFVLTGKLDFKSLADSIVADITRIIIKEQLSKILRGLGGGDILGSLFGSLFGGGGSALGFSNAAGISGGRAIGGPVSAGRLYPINEKGQPEILSTGGRDYLLMGNQSGQVKPPVGRDAGDRSIVMQLTQHFAAGTTRQTAEQAARAASREMQRAMARGTA